MKGHIRARGKGAWELKYDLGPDPITGARRVRFATVHGGKRDAQAELTRRLNQVQDGDHPEASAELTVGAYLETWLRDHAAARVSGKTLERYSEIVRRQLIPALGSVALIKLTPAAIQAAHAAALASGRRRPARDGSKGLSAQTVKHHHRVLSEALKQAVRLGLIARNPAERVDPPRPARTEMKILNPAQTAELLNALDGSSLHLPVLLAVTTGARRGEVLALRWKDIDLDRGVASIAQTLEETTAAGLVFKAPKTERSRRLIALPALAVEALRRHRAGQAAERLRRGRDWIDHDLVFCNAIGLPLSPRVVSKAFRKARDKLGLAVRLHDLRHTHISHLLAAGVHPKVASERAGHSSVSITLDIYSHLLPGMQEDAANRIDTVLRTHLERGPAQAG